MDALLTAAQVGELLGVEVETLAVWRKTPGRGPHFIRWGRKHSPIRYRRSAVEAWVAAHEHADEASAQAAGC